MAIGRISGSVLKSNLTRNGVDLAFETNLLYLDVTNSRVGIGTSEPNTTLHVVGNTTITGDLSVSGNVSFEIGSINSLNTGALIVDDNNITGTRSNEDIIVSAAGTGRIVLKNTLIANTLQSDDSTAVQINDALNVSGTFHAATIVTNDLISEDSTAINVLDGMNVSGTLTANTAVINNINTADSSDIHINGAFVNFAGGGTVLYDEQATLNNLYDVEITNPAVDQFLRYNGTHWVNGQGATVSAGVGVGFWLTAPTISGVNANNANPIASLSISPGTTTELTITKGINNTTDIIGAFVSGALNRTVWDGGNWLFANHVYVNSSTGTSTVTDAIYTVLPFVTGTVTITGTGTSRTATASAGTPFATAAIDASATNTDASFLQTPQGLYQITARSSDTVVTITTPSGYTNESAVAGTVWKKWFVGNASAQINNTTVAQFDTDTTKGSLSVTTDTRIGLIIFGTTTSNRTISIVYDASLNASSFVTPLAAQHKDLAGLQGGQANEFYHLTEAEYTGTGTGAFVRASGADLTNPHVTGSLHVTTIDSTDSTTIEINSGVDVNGTLLAPTFITNNISSSDSTAIQIDDGVNISGTLNAKTLITNTIGSEDSSAIQINDAVNVSGTLTVTGLVANGITYPSLDGSANQILTTNGAGVLSFTSLSAFTGITFVGDDSTGSTINTAETFKIAGTQNITTAVSGDTLTITGPNLSSYLTNSTITVVGDDSTGTTLNTGETIKITGTSNISTAVSGDTLTITGPNLTGYAQKTDTAITIVGDDSTGTAVTVGETFKIAGGSNITTSVSGDVLTINGSNPAQGITFIGDDSTGTAIADGGTLQIVGAGSVDTSISGNVLTITGTSSIDSLNTGGLLIDDNKITGQRSNEDIEISTSGTGVITTNASIIPTTDDTLDLGSLTKRFKTGYFGSGTVYIGDQTISSSKTGLIFSGRINTPSSMLDASAKIISKIGIDTSEKTIDSFSTSDIRSALYYQVYRDEVRNAVIASKVSIVHDGLEAFISKSAVVSSDNISVNEGPIISTEVVGNNLLYKITGNSAINSVQCYRLPLRDSTGRNSLGRTATLRYENLSTAETVIDTWSINEYRSAKYFVLVSDEGAQIQNDYLTAEISMVHDGSDAYITTYNVLSSSDESFVIFTADLSDGLVRLKARSTGGTLNLKLHKSLLSDTESNDETDYQKIIGTVTASSAATTVDSFHITDTTAVFYTISAHDSNNNQSSISEVIVVHDSNDAHVITGPQLSTDGVIHLEWSTYIQGNQVFLQASGSESEIKITGYKISLYRPDGGNSNSSLSAQGITFVGDDSTGTRIADNETVKITGGTGITTSMTGDTLTITATGEATAQGLTFVGDDSSGTRISDGETVKITGSGGITTAMSGDTLTITGPTAFTFSVAGDDSTQRAISTGNTIKFVGSNGITTATDAEGNVTISGTTLVTLNIDGGATATVYDLTGLNLDGGSSSSTYGEGETSVNGGGA